MKSKPRKTTTKKKKSRPGFKPMSKAKFDALPKAEQRIVIAKDVISRIKVNNIKPHRGDFLNIPSSFKHNVNFSLKEYLNDENTSCEACAKGGLFCSWVVINNKFTRTSDLDASIDSGAMKALSKVFTKKQLALIETAFEGTYYKWNESLSSQEIQKCVDFYEECLGSDERFTAICQNIIANKGTFKP